MPRSILIVDDDARVRASLSDALAAHDVNVTAVESAEHALSVIVDARPDVVLSDVRMQGMDGLQLLRLLRERVPGLDVVLMTAYDDLATVAAAMRAGASDFLVKPLDLHQLRSVLAKVFADRDARARRPGKAEDNAGGTTQYELVGRDPRMIDIFKIVGQVAASRTTVMIRGESGTGKELIARAIHSTSPYASEPFVAVNCTALPSTLLESELFGHMRGSFTGATADRRGRFGQAGRGTIFLDEIGDTTPEFQSKLLRVLQEHEFYPVGADKPQRAEARVIAATHRNLERLVQNGEFREDLYYRLRVVEIAIPPLRERMSDVALLAKALVRRASEVAGRETPVLAREALDAMMAHTWPGNVRELENAVTRAVVLATGGVIRPEQLGMGAPQETAGRAPSLTTLEAREAEHVTHVLETVQWHKARAARILGVSRPRLDRLLRKYSIAVPDRRPS